VDILSHRLKKFFSSKKLTSIETLVLCIRNGSTSSRDSNHAKKIITSINQTQIVAHRLDSIAANNSIKEYTKIDQSQDVKKEEPEKEYQENLKIETLKKFFRKNLLIDDVEAKSASRLLHQISRTTSKKITTKRAIGNTREITKFVPVERIACNHFASKLNRKNLLQFKKIFSDLNSPKKIVLSTKYSEENNLANDHHTITKFEDQVEVYCTKSNAMKTAMFSNL